MGYSFDDFIYDAKKCVDKAGEKAGEAINYSKLSLEKAEIKGRLRERYAELGKFCYKMHETGTDYSGNMKGTIREINNLEDRLKETDDALKIPKTCSLCGAKNPSDSMFCSKCGEKLSR